MVFDQSVFVKEAIKTLLHEGLIGLLLTSPMILVFLGSFRATTAVFLSIPLSALATFVVLNMSGSTINTMILGGLALAFSRIIDNSVISLENIYRHLEMGASPMAAAEVGGNEVSLAVLAATLTTVVVFFPVTFLYGVSKFLFSALALAVVISLFASYFVAMTVIPLFCSRFLKAVPHAADQHAENNTEYRNRAHTAACQSWWDRFTAELQPAIQPAVGLLRVLGEAGAGAPWAYGGGSEWSVSGQPGYLSLYWSGLLSREPMPVSSPSTSRFRPELALRSPNNTWPRSKI